MTATADFKTLSAMLGDRDMADVFCPWCGPARREAPNRTRKVLRLWAAPGFITFHCVRCGEHGFIHEYKRRPIDREALQRAHATVAERDRDEIERQRLKAIHLWRMGRPINGTAAETYLREVRGIACPLPPTLGYLPSRGEYPPAMIAAFGIPDEPEPGVLTVADAAVRGVHLTKLRSDGSGKAGTDKDKIMVGRSKGAPIVIAAINDLLGLAITEGIECALSVHCATGLGAWAAGAASRMPALADAVPDYTSCVSVFADGDEAGQRNATLLADRLNARGIHAEVVPSDGARP